MKNSRLAALGAAAIVAAMSTSGCAVVPTAFSAGAMVANGISYAATGKGTADHILSGLSGQDCAILRGLGEDPVCREVETAERNPADRAAPPSVAGDGPTQGGAVAETGASVDHPDSGGR